MSEEDRVMTQFRQPIEGQLLKFTNVMKGFQPRWFLLDSERFVIEYYEKEEFRRSGQKARGSLHLFGAAIYPSEEDSQTFTVQSAGPVNEAFRLKAADAKERQRWIMHLRAVSEHAQPHSFVPLNTDSLNGSCSNLRSVSEPVSQQQVPAVPVASWMPPTSAAQPYAAQNAQPVLPTSGPQQSQIPPSGGEQEPVNVLELSNSDVHKQLVELIERMQQECELTSAHIGALPAPNTSTETPGATTADGDGSQQSETQIRSLDCLDPDLLMMKATIRAAVACVTECHALLDPRRTALSGRTTIASPKSRTRTSKAAQNAHAATGGHVRSQSARTTSSASKPRSASAYQNVGAAVDINELEEAIEAIYAERDVSRTTTVSLCTAPSALTADEVDTHRRRAERSDSFVSAVSSVGTSVAEAPANEAAFSDLIPDYFGTQRPTATG